MNRITFPAAALAILTVSLLAACGGGGFRAQRHDGSAPPMAGRVPDVFTS